MNETSKIPAGRQEIPILSRITKYISFKLMGEEAESQYQLISKIQKSLKPNVQIYRILHTETDMNITFTKFIESELEQHFFAFMQRSTWIDFLQYHLSKYLETNPDDEAVFFDFILDLIGCKYLDMTNGNDIADWPLTTLPKSRIDEITTWVYQWEKPARQEVTEPQPKEGTRTFNEKPEFSLGRIALIHVYKGMTITRDNGQDIAINHGWTAKSSGERLYQLFSKYSTTANRKGIPINPSALKIQNKINLFESILSHLNNDEQEQLNKEIKPLKIKLETNDY